MPQDRGKELIEARENILRELGRMEGDHSAPAILGRLERLIDAKIAIALNQETTDALGIDREAGRRNEARS